MGAAEKSNRAEREKGNFEEQSLLTKVTKNQEKAWQRYRKTDFEGEGEGNADVVRHGVVRHHILHWKGKKKYKLAMFT